MRWRWSDPTAELVVVVGGDDDDDDEACVDHGDEDLIKRGRCEVDDENAGTNERTTPQPTPPPPLLADGVGA